MGDNSTEQVRGATSRRHAVALGPAEVFHTSVATMNLDFQVHSRQSRTLMSLSRVQVLPPELCDQIIAGLDDEWTEGEVGTGSDDIFETVELSAAKRSVQLQRLKVDEHQFPLGLIVRSIAEVNSAYFRFDLTGTVVSDWPSVLRYSAGRGDHYTPHVDVGDEFSTRKLSFVVQLTDPSEYQGGRLELMFGLGDDAATEKGWMTVFPSYRPHHVTPVTEGVRHAIVGWVHGPSFR
ncbi:MAG: 2OG-Fe(II) oxygenase [Ilumatobacteraceae bacterium]|uniref:2OG-Fe(II) oxygenase family protein n=1 Tax=Candidatus Neomicrothrix sp. TaxID=2719034 RepID=UPI001B4E8A43|nr:2OG-Fe(II) oxygenase [Candidatus Microthrix sp.]MBP7995513.1 2OG-Fe(II) oxygenase [Candidatus Microthrix sp.]MBP8209885.1 2OG-Fe(II) oxygenase [Ilumatobacteraceae bacterium]MBP9051411.1 2OG-Fe(II) oxygenase [Ilumatobacteraceae bacterium]